MRISLGIAAIAVGAAVLVGVHLALSHDPLPPTPARLGADGLPEVVLPPAWLPAVPPETHAPQYDDARQAAREPRTDGADRAGTHAQATSTTRAVLAENAAAVPAQVIQDAQAAHRPRTQPRPELVRELQRELKRVGCYASEINGDWSTASRRGMRAFLDHANSGLRGEEPEDILLLLVRGHAGAACGAPGVPIAGAPSAAGAAAASTGSIITGPIAQLGNATAGVPGVDGSTPLEGRMAVGGPVPDDPQAQPYPSQNASPAVARARPPRSTAAPARTDRNWTGSFFGGTP